MVRVGEAIEWTKKVILRQYKITTQQPKGIEKKAAATAT